MEKINPPHIRRNEKFEKEEQRKESSARFMDAYESVKQTEANKQLSECNYLSRFFEIINTLDDFFSSHLLAADKTKCLLQKSLYFAY